MDEDRMDWVNRLQEPKFWLLGIAAALIALHLTLLNQAHQSELLMTSTLFWLVAVTLIWDRRQSLTLHSDVFSTVLGGLLLAILLLRSSAIPDVNSFLRGFPLAAALGWCLIASGMQRLHHYWRELFIFGLLFIQPAFELVLKLVNLSKLTAMSANFMLWYTGFDVYRQGVFLQLPTGRVEVYDGCAGSQSILQMLNIAILLLMMVTLRSIGQRFFCILLAVLLAFFVNSARVALMAVLVARKSAFEYWHTGTGSLIFSVITVLLFSGLCWFLFLRSPKKELDAGATHD